MKHADVGSLNRACLTRHARYRQLSTCHPRCLGGMGWSRVDSGQVAVTANRVTFRTNLTHIARGLPRRATLRSITNGEIACHNSLLENMRGGDGGWPMGEGRTRRPRRLCGSGGPEQVTLACPVGAGQVSV